MLKQRGTWHFLINRNLSDDEIQTFVREKNLVVHLFICSSDYLRHFQYDSDLKTIMIPNTRDYVSIFACREKTADNVSTYFIACNFDFLKTID